MLWYSQPSGQRHRIGQCIFSGGVNEPSYEAIDRDGNGTADCLSSTKWRTIDGADNDAERRIGSFVFTTGQESYLDTVTFTYDATTNKLSWINEKYEYPIGTTDLPMERVSAYIEYPQIPVPGLGHVEDPLVGETTEQLFDGLLNALQSEPRRPRRVVARFDLDFNGRCDETDKRIFAQAVGTCQGQAAFRRLADIDGDGCVNEVDAKGWLRTYLLYSRGCTHTSEHWKWLLDKSSVKSMELGGRSYSKRELGKILRHPARENGLVALAHQLIAAKLNVTRGAAAITATIAASDRFITAAVGGFGAIPPIGDAAVSRSWVVQLEGLLEAYNAGISAPGRCKLDSQARHDN
jgi:hypothetical protein